MILTSRNNLPSTALCGCNEVASAQDNAGAPGGFEVRAAGRVGQNDHYAAVRRVVVTVALIVG